MITNPLVSVGIPTFNRPRDLVKCIELLLNQTYQNLEIIVVDNFSDHPESIQLLNNWPYTDPRVKLIINSKNYGVLKNAQIALDNANGELFCWVSDDDWRSDVFIEELVQQLLKTGKGHFANSFYREIISEFRINKYSFKFDRFLCLFSSKWPLLNQLLYFLVDHSLGKCNLFYSLFWKSDLDQLSLQKASFDWNDLSMDRNLIFSALGKLKLIVVPKVLFSLKTQNKKHYKKYHKSLSLTQKAKNYLKAISSEYVYTYNNMRANLFIVKFLLIGVLPFKIFSLVTTKLFFIALKIICNLKYLVKAPLFTRESEAISKIENSILKPDIKLKLDDVTLVCVATVDVEKAVMALLYSSINIQFSQILLLSNYKPWNLPDKVSYKRIKGFSSVDDWCEFVFKDLYSYIKSPYIILIHPDGYIVDYRQWKSEFLQFDYIGAPWPWPKDSVSYRTEKGKIIRVGNSVSLRSKRLLEAPLNLNLKWEKFHGNFNEDGIICVKYHDILTENNFKFPPVHLAYKFSIETNLPALSDQNSFAFHRWLGSNSKYPRFSNY